MSEDTKNRLLILPEHAACQGENGVTDAFELNAKLGRLLSAIRAKSTKLPLAIALTGDWGTGKSSAMHWLEGQLASSGPGTDQAAFETCFFKPWKYQTRESVLNGLLAVVISAIRPDGGPLAKTGAGAVAVVDGVLSFIKSFRTAGGDQVGIGGGIRAAAKEGERIYQEITQPERLFSNEFEQALNDALDEYLGETKRLAIFIDDLDRCLPEVAIQILEAIKLFFDQSKVVFVLGVDRDVVDRMMVRHYHEALKPNGPEETAHVARKARQYLDKMFQVEVQIPPTDAQVGEFAESQLTRLEGWHELSELHQKRLIVAIRAVAGINPRGVIRALNSAFVAAGQVIDNIKAAKHELENAKSHKGDKPNSEADAAQKLDGLRVALAQSVQRRLVEAVLAGSEVAALAAKSTAHTEGEQPYDASVPRFEEWHGLARHTHGRQFLRAWSIAVQTEGTAQYLRPEQTVLGWKSTGDKLLAITEEEFGQSTTGEQVEHSDIPDALKGLIEVARSFPALASLLSVRAMGPVLAVVEYATASTTTNNARHDRQVVLPLIKVVASLQQVDPGAVETSDFLNQTNLNLMGMVLGDEELDGLSKLKKLTHLVLDGVPISNLTALSELHELLSLDLDRTRVFDVSPLASLTKLRRLYLSHTKVSDIRAIANLVDLDRLILARTQVADLGALRGLLNLKWLSVAGTKVSDVSPLFRHNQLMELDISETLVSDIRPLARLQRLEYVCLPDRQTWRPGSGPPPHPWGKDFPEK